MKKIEKVLSLMEELNFSAEDSAELVKKLIVKYPLRLPEKALLMLLNKPQDIPKPPSEETSTPPKKVRRATAPRKPKTSPYLLAKKAAALVVPEKKAPRGPSFDYLYLGADGRSLIHSPIRRYDREIQGIIIPYCDRKGYFGVSFRELKEVVSLKEANAFARTMPKYNGCSWEVWEFCHRDSVAQYQEELDTLLGATGGDAISQNYLLNDLFEQDSHKTRFAVDIID